MHNPAGYPSLGFPVNADRKKHSSTDASRHNGGQIGAPLNAPRCSV